MNQEDENLEHAFYDDLDRKTVKKSCCSWQTFILFFVILAILSSGFTVYSFYKIKQSDPSITFSIEKLYPENVSKESFSNKLKINATNPTFSIVLTSQELTSVLSTGVKAVTFEIKDVQVEISPSGMNIFGKLTKPLNADIKIETAPSPQDGRVFFKVTKITAGKLVLPGLLNSEIEKALNNVMDENFQPLYDNYRVENVELRQDVMIISGKLR